MMERLFSMDTLWWVLMLIYIPACIALIVIVLLQKGKGTGFAGAFGAGAGPGSDTVFGPRMSRSLPIRLTYISAAVFMIIAVIMSLIAGEVGRGVAPELVQEEAAAEGASGTGSPLATYGLGTNRADESRVDEAPPPPVDAAEEAAPAAEEAPAEGAAEQAAPQTEESPAESARVESAEDAAVPPQETLSPAPETDAPAEAEPAPVSQ